MKSTTVTKAALNAAAQLGMTDTVLANVIGVSKATVSRMRSDKYQLQPGQKSFELAVMFVALYRSLRTIVGGDDTVASAWLRSRNVRLRDAPLTFIQTVSGLANVVQYLDARRRVV